MGLNDTPRGERIHIAIFGKRNAGKSSIVNAITNQNIAIVSKVKGTTTDPVYKAMELLPLGPVMLIDTPGLDDNSELGSERIKKTIQVLQKTDIAIIVIDIMSGFSKFEQNLLGEINNKKLPCIIVLNKIDMYTKDVDKLRNELKELTKCQVISVSAQKQTRIHELKETIARLVPKEEERYPIVRDLIHRGDVVVLVVPIDSSAPKARLILPQQQTIRDILDGGGISMVAREKELKQTLDSLDRKPKLVITDSKVFDHVSKIVPQDIMLTSFSILFSRHKGDLEEQVAGIKTIENLKDGDKILIAEGCTHHRQCDDIGTIKLPKWLLEFTKQELVFEFTSGTQFPKNLKEYALIIHCGACTLNKKEMEHRIKNSKKQNIPIVNYGILIAYMKGILERSLKPFPNMSNF